MKLVFHSTTITMMHGPISIRFTCSDVGTVAYDNAGSSVWLLIREDIVLKYRPEGVLVNFFLNSESVLKMKSDCL